MPCPRAVAAVAGATVHVRYFFLSLNVISYDVVAPRIDGKRRIEVKTSGRSENQIFRFFISRNEIDWGLRDPDWAFVACRVGPTETLELVGWCRAEALEIYLPSDS